MSEERQRDQSASNVLFTSPVMGRDEALEWEKKAYKTNLIEEPFTPAAVGPLDIGVWPDDQGSDELLELNEDKGNLPADADLEYGITVKGIVLFHGLSKRGEGFVAIMSADEVNYAQKVTEPVGTAAEAPAPST